MRRLIFLCLTAVLALPAQAQEPEQPKNVILMIADGFGPASATMARTAIGHPLALDAILTGSVATGATDSDVTDSAAAGTAYACGIKTYNGAIAVDTLRAPCRTILEAAEERGMATGLVATSRITHATPASFAAHVESRGMEEEIADQMLARDIEVILGGGRTVFDSAVQNLSHEPQAYRSAETRDELMDIDATPVVGLFSDSHMAYEIDRDEAEEPSLAEMTRKALELLSASNDGQENGFFLMVEGSRIDHAAHGNDPAGHLHDILAYDEAVAVALEFARRDGNTLVVSTADHETGGMTLGRDGIYAWDPVYLMSVRSSFDAMGVRVLAGEPIVEVIADAAAAELTSDEISTLETGFADRDMDLLAATVRDIVSTRAGIGWTTDGHTAVDVGLYSYGPGSELFRGYMENDEVGRRLFEVMGF